MKYFLFVCCLYFLSGLAQAQSLEPGVWHAQTNFKVDGFPLSPSVGEECVTPEEARDAKATITKELQKIGCVLTAWTVVNNNLQASLECKNNDVKASGNLSGQFSQKNYHLEGSAHGFYKTIIPSVASVSLDGAWVRVCP